VRRLRCLGQSSAARFGQRLRARRLRGGLTQGELVHRCDLARSTICAYERGAPEPTATALERLVRELGWGLANSNRRAGSNGKNGIPKNE
jgi:DNA-binding XRE family transcriptional regulator